MELVTWSSRTGDTTAARLNETPNHQTRGCSAITFQSTELTREWICGDDSADPKNPKSVAWNYAQVTALIYAAGFALVLFGSRPAARRPERAVSRLPEHV